MTIDQDVTAGTDLLSEMLVHFEVERLYFLEAALLDAHKYDEWIQLFTDDVHYFMPIRRTRSKRELDQEFTQPGEMAWFDDTKMILQGRVAKIATGTAWAEDPPSRTRHLITNIRVVGNRIDEDLVDELHVESNFHLYRTRLKSEEQSWIGSRQDVLRRVEGKL
ncbi:MAG: 3-phenylpropionate/cinnamic acid dioxygenase subunit beta, partial [Actinobacteria bacterium]